NARLELLDASGNPLLSVNDGASSSVTNGPPGFSPSSPSEGLVYRSAVEGVFFARVSISPLAAGQAAFGNYLLSISKNCVIGSSGLNHRPALTNVVLPSPVTAGTAVPLTGAVWDPDTGDALSLVVTWGDGSTNLVESPEPGLIELNLTHEYLLPDTNYVVTVVAKDRAGNTASVSRPITIQPTALVITFAPGGPVQIGFQGRPQGRYRIEKANTLPPVWSELQTVTANATGKVLVTDTQPSPSSRYYRLVILN
ncbi:MAG TPA: PKD domain-containing protein, partial [Candidatus Dormibacteraeota bacterium]|nr:PKD domain-containing protein [Candidatus Dormibacteraeota bacterium]